MTERAAENLDFEPAGPPGAPPPTTAPAHRPGGALGAGYAVPGERTISPVSGRFGRGAGGKALAFLGLLAGSGVFLAATWSHPRGRPAKTTPEEPARQVVDFASVRAVRPAESAASAGLGAPGALRSLTGPIAASGSPGPGPGADAALAGADGPVVPALAVAPAGVGTGDAKAAAAQQAAQARAAQLQAIRSAPLVAFSADGRAAGSAGASLLADGARADAGGTELDQLRRGSTIGRVRAQRLPDRNFLVVAGALLPCVLETAIETSAPGFVTCRLSRDVYSDNGGVVVMEKGSRVLGEYRSGFQQGRARIFVLWDRITTPGGVAVDVGSPASDALGRAGFDGAIDSHFWQRFGGALLLTAVSGAVSAAATADARVANVAQAPNEAAAAALQNSVSIPPTLRKPQGAEVAIFVSRDLDFSSVYALEGR